MSQYKHEIESELEVWMRAMSKAPGSTSRLRSNLQGRINRAIPEQVHKVITTSIKQMTRTVIFGSKYSTRTKDHLLEKDLETTESMIRDRINFYCSSASVEGAITGAGGILMGFADFPLWLTLKMKMLFEIASYYGMEVKDYRERIYILHIFQMTFSKQAERRKTFELIRNWDTEKEKLPESIHDFDWKTFQIEYRDYLDILKLLQLIPGFGAIVGAYVNHKYTARLGKFAMNAYRLRVM
jgi:uncharacterized protein (DUF697 family)